MSKKKKTSGRFIFIVTALVLVGLGTWAYAVAHKARQPVANSSELPGMQAGAVPWTPDIIHLKQRLAAIGIPALSQEGSVMHTHQHLDVYINGSPVPIPSGIGVNEAVGFISPVHTHDNTGVIHIESPTVRDYTLGDFFDIFGVPFTASTIGNYHVDSTHPLKVYVNGTQITGDPRAVVLESHQEIVVVYGEAPATIPSTYAFGPNL